METTPIVLALVIHSSTCYVDNLNSIDFVHYQVDSQSYRILPAIYYTIAD